METELEPVEHEVERFEPCDSCNIPPTGTGHRTVFRIQTHSETRPVDILCERCLEYHGYTLEKNEVFIK